MSAHATLSGTQRGAVMSVHRFAALLSVVLLSPTASAAPVAVTNPGFEDLYQGVDVPTGSFPVGPAPNGWTRYDLGGTPVAGSLLGVLNPGTQADYDADPGTADPCFPAGAPEGDNVALLFKSGAAAADEYGIEQTLAATLQPNTRYTLTVEVGNIQTCGALGSNSNFDLDGFPGYRIELRAGTDVLVADDDTLAPPEGVFETSSIEFVSGPSPPPSALTIRLIGLNQATGAANLEVDFDDVRLDAEPISPVGVSHLLIPLVVALAWSGARRLR